MGSEPDHARKGRPPRISRAVVVRAGLDLAEQDGLDALTIKRVAERLGVAPMALYRHIENKQVLLEAVSDAALAQVDLPLESDDPFRDIADLARRVRAVLVRYPGTAAHAFVAGFGRHDDLRMVEWSLATLLRAGLEPDEAGRAHALLFGHVIGLSRMDDDGSRAAHAREHQRKADELEVQADATSFPALAAVAPALARLEPDDHFEYGLARLLDGLRYQTHGP